MKDKNIKSIIFDIDGVLLDSFEANLKFFQDMMLKFGYRAPTKESYLKVFYLTTRDTIKALTRSVNEEEINKIWEASKNREVPYPNYLLKTPEGLEDVLEGISQSYSLAIVTSRIKESIFEAPQMIKLKKYFPIVISAYDTKLHKPNPEPLLLAAEKLGVKPEECVYIGDAETDILAAKAAGMKMILYSKNKIKGADYITSSFLEIIALIEKCE